MSDNKEAVGICLISREEALERATAFLRQQSWTQECDENSARVIESNECINILFKYREIRKPQETIISVDKIGGAVNWIKLG